MIGNSCDLSPFTANGVKAGRTRLRSLWGLPLYGFKIKAEERRPTCWHRPTFVCMRPLLPRPQLHLAQQALSAGSPTAPFWYCVRIESWWLSSLRFKARRATATAGSSLPQMLPNQAEGHRFEGSYLELSQRIVFEQKEIGTIVIRTGLEAMRDRLLQYFAITALVLLASTVVSIFASLRFQRIISRPISELAATAKNVSRNKDFSIRATAYSRDEIGQLVETFNEMLSRIQEQNLELKEAHDQLELRVIDRTAQLEAVNKELEAFSYSVSHDLRAPLRSIDGFSQALLEDYGDKLDPQGQDDLQRVRGATQRMGQLIDDMLHLSRVTRDEMCREELDISALVRMISTDLRTSEPKRQADFAIADDIKANADARLVRILLENLLGNAWKFTSKRQAAKIEFGVDCSNGNPVYFVRDDGAGFDMAYADKLFGAFQRLHSMTEFKGTGIGLATVQRIAARHGGRVWAESKVDKLHVSVKGRVSTCRSSFESRRDCLFSSTPRQAADALSTAASCRRRRSRGVVGRGCARRGRKRRGCIGT